MNGWETEESIVARMRVRLVLIKLNYVPAGSAETVSPRQRKRSINVK